mmetsp:Transcript_24755/g.60828  ORF Transcript_24755/g.60828 Transcript_24755/m.60828 type:complete len:232 (+) Transcript_24755:1357-2052(+)
MNPPPTTTQETVTQEVKVVPAETKKEKMDTEPPSIMEETSASTSTENPKGPDTAKVESAEPPTEQTPRETMNLPEGDTATPEDNEMPETKKEQEMDTEPPIRQPPIEHTGKEDPTKTNETTADEHPSHKIEKSTESPHVDQAEDSEPSMEQKPTENADLPAAEEKKDEEVVQQADELQETEKVIDVESPAEQAPPCNQKDSAKGSENAVDETETKESSSSSSSRASTTIQS